MNGIRRHLRWSIPSEYAMLPLDDHQVPTDPHPDQDPVPDEKPSPDDDPVPDHNPVTEVTHGTLDT